MQGQIRVQTENIFPIIKKFLYSDHEIFVRELVSNAVDATTKVKTLASSGKYSGELGDLKIEIAVDEEKKTISIRDYGIGLSGEEADKYLNQVAFSGAEEFLEKYKGQTEQNIIGHFGLGFYSAFMVSSKVDVISQSMNDAEDTIIWSCDGSPNYSIEKTDKQARGTNIVLHVNEESAEFLDKTRLETVLKKFCTFLPVPIWFDGKQVNNPTPAWVKKPSELTEEDYKNFYKELYPYSEPPLFWIHLNVDYPFNLQGILYFPKIKHSYEIQKDKIQLYCNQVFVTDEVKDIVPEFLMLLHGVIDSPDIPLNVSRSYLQGDPNVKKITSHITKKVGDKLEEMFKKERENFEAKWEDVGMFVKYGMITDDKFLEKGKNYVVFENVSTVDDKKEFLTVDEYKNKVEAKQKNKDGKYVVLYSNDAVKQNTFIKAAEDKGYTIVKMDTLIDSAFISNIEMKLSDISFKRVDADIADNLIDEDGAAAESVLSADEVTALTDMFKANIGAAMADVKVKGLSADAPPVIATKSEMMRRMKEMASSGGPGASFYASMPDEINITVNGNHPIYQKIIKEANEEIKQTKVKNLADLALLSQGMLQGEALTEFIGRTVRLM
jgi:molecular chaperone HtpG